MGLPAAHSSPSGRRTRFGIPSSGVQPEEVGPASPASEPPVVERSSHDTARGIPAADPQRSNREPEGASASSSIADRWELGREDDDDEGEKTQVASGNLLNLALDRGAAREGQGFSRPKVNSPQNLRTLMGMQNLEADLDDVEPEEADDSTQALSADELRALETKIRVEDRAWGEPAWSDGESSADDATSGAQETSAEVDRRRGLLEKLKQRASKGSSFDAEAAPRPLAYAKTAAGLPAVAQTSSSEVGVLEPGRGAPRFEIPSPLGSSSTEPAPSLADEPLLAHDGRAGQSELNAGAAPEPLEHTAVLDDAQILEMALDDTGALDPRELDQLELEELILGEGETGQQEVLEQGDAFEEFEALDMIEELDALEVPEVFDELQGFQGFDEVADVDALDGVSFEPLSPEERPSDRGSGVVQPAQGSPGASSSLVQPDATPRASTLDGFGGGSGVTQPGDRPRPRFEVPGLVGAEAGRSPSGVTQPEIAAAVSTEVPAAAPAGRAAVGEDAPAAMVPPPVEAPPQPTASPDAAPPPRSDVKSGSGQLERLVRGVFAVLGGLLGIAASATVVLQEASLSSDIAAQLIAFGPAAVGLLTIFAAFIPIPTRAKTVALGGMTLLGIALVSASVMLEAPALGALMLFAGALLTLCAAVFPALVKLIK